MEKNYMIIVDEIELDEFIDFLPELKEDEAYYISLMARSKYLKGTKYESTLKGDRSKLKRAIVTDKKRIKQKIRQMEIAVGAYGDDKGNSIPQESLALYIKVNPRNLKVASKNLSKSIIDALYEGKFINPHTESLKAIQNSKKDRRYLEYDFDLDKTLISAEGLKDEIVGATGLSSDYFVIVETRGGYHVLVNTLKMKGLKFNWMIPFTELWKKYSTDVENGGDQMIPVPGSYQGGFVPRLFVF